MTFRGRQPLLAVMLVGVSSLTVREARADDAACIAASENEVGLRKQGKIRDAMKELAKCAASTCPAEVSAECGRRIQELNAALPTVVLSATDAGGSELVAVSVTVDGAAFASALDGRAIPIDPGSHAFHFEAAGVPPVDRTFVIHEGEKGRRLTVPLVAPGAGPAPVPGLVPAPLAPTVGPAVETTRAPSSWNTNKTLAIVSGSVGVVGLGLGAAMGLAASSAWSSSKSLCSATNCPTSTRATAVSDHDSAVQDGTISTVGLAVGAVGIVGGVVLWLTAPKGERAPSPATAARLTIVPQVSPGRGGVLLSGSFQ
jgi:hypothetical protein